MSDPIVDQVIAKFQSRSAIGARKYGTTLHANNKDNYLLHLQEELMDGCNYIEKLMTQNQELIEIVRNTPNDQDLGRKIRDMVR
jgi:hypothetical protein